MSHASTLRLAVVLALGWLPLTAFATDYVDEPLTGPGGTGFGQRGGSFSASGWTTSAPNDTLWWTIDEALESGTISFDLTGLTSALNPGTGDNDLVSFYQAPQGVAEPIGYNPWFRNNDLRVFLRMFTTYPGEMANGAIKLESVGCMVGAPYFNNTCPATSCAFDGIAYCNGGYSDCGWDPTHTYHFEIAWGAGSMTWKRDGQVMGTTSYPSSFAPKPLTVHLGSPRNAAVGDSAMPSGLTYANVKVSGSSGVQTPACGTVTPPPPPTPVGGACTAPTVGASEDVTAASWETGVDGYVGDLNVEGDGSGLPSGVAYVKFPATGGAVSQATLTLHTLDTSSAHGGSGQVCLVSSGGWSETTLTWANRPAVGTVCTGGARTVNQNTEVSWDVTALLNAAPSGAVSLAVVSADPDGAHFYSKESGGCSLGPRLDFTLAPPPTTVVDAGTPPPVTVVDAGTPPPAAQEDAGTPPVQGGSDAGSPPVAVDGGAGPEHLGGGVGPVMGGCGCSGAGAGLQVLASLMLLVARRSARRSREV